MNDNPTPLKGLTALIYRDALGIDFSNRGISATATEVTVVGPGIDPIFEATAERPAVRIIRREHANGAIYHAEPLPTEDEPSVWYMFGGTFIFSSDSRFRTGIDFYGAVPLHDRRE
ncbi:hypothetical protein GCM10009825_14260 [Arthrobacter humicola]|uniref:Uncharacterized protein n=1 Tax=Arthrobacter humicola TaxID=409291 RepID=A0ABN2YVR5_9MICC